MVEMLTVTFLAEECILWHIGKGSKLLVQTSRDVVALIQILSKILHLGRRDINFG